MNPSHYDLRVQPFYSEYSLCLALRCECSVQALEVSEMVWRKFSFLVGMAVLQSCGFREVTLKRKVYSTTLQTPLFSGTISQRRNDFTKCRCPFELVSAFTVTCFEDYFWTTTMPWVALLMTSIVTYVLR